LDRGTQRCPQRALLLSDSYYLRALHTRALTRPLSDDVDLVHVRVDVETNAGHNTGHPAFARLLAAPAHARFKIILAINCRETSALDAFRGVVDQHIRSARALHRFDRAITFRLATPKRACQLRHLHLANDLAGGSRGVLSASGKSSRTLAGGKQRGVSFGNYIVRFFFFGGRVLISLSAGFGIS